VHLLLNSCTNETESSGTLGFNPFTTTNGSTTVAVTLLGHGFNQDSLINIVNSTAFNGVTINGTFPITSIIDVNTFNIDITSVGTPTGTGAGGGNATYLCDNLIMGQPNWYGIWDEAIHFDQAFSQTSLCKLQYFKSKSVLTSPSQTNFIINRYPQLFRMACQAAEANVRRDAQSYMAIMERLKPMIDAVNIENDESLRGMELDTITP
jgi:hypothetical protein